MPGVANCFSKVNPLTRPQVPWFLMQCSFFYGSRGGSGGAIGIVQKVGRCTRTGEILILYQQHCPSAKLTCLESGEVSN